MHQGKQLKQFHSLTNRLFVIALFVLTSVLGITYSADAGQAILSWNPPTTNADGTPLTDLAGYKVYYGTASGVYSSTLDVGNVTTYTASNLSDGITYYFAVTTYDTSGYESGYSNEVSKTTSDVTPPVISGITASSITSTSVVITWTTDEASTSQVEYGTTTSHGSSTTLDNTLVTSHSVTLSGLSTWTTYHFSVKSQDAAGNLATSADNTFTVLVTPDTTPPTGTISINNGAAYTTSPTVTLNLSCNDSSTGCSQMEFSNDGTTWSTWESYATTKTWTLSDGDGNKTVHVQYKDSAGNISADYTDIIPLDTTSPVISGTTANNVTANSASITWTTDEPATSQVEYGTSALYGSLSSLNDSFTTSHTVTLSGLTSDTVYHFRILSGDQAGNKGMSSDYTSTTLKVTQSDTPATITDLRVRDGASTRNSVLLDWTATGADGTSGTASIYDLRMSTLKIIEDGITPAQGEVNFSDATRINSLPAPKVAGSSESLEATQLETNSVYYFAIKAIDDKGNISPLSNVVNGNNIPPLPVTALRHGYTMIAFPLIPDTADTQTLLGGIVENTVELYWWSSDGLGDNKGTFVAENNAVPGYGYFLKSNIDTAVLNIKGAEVTDPSRTISLQPGWNMIGNPYPKEVSLRNTYIRRTDTGELKNYEDAVISGWVSNAIYHYNGSTYTFDLYTDATLKLWQGYWLAVLQNGQYEILIYQP